MPSSSSKSVGKCQPDGSRFFFSPKLMLCAIITTSIFLLATRHWTNGDPVQLTFLGYTNLDIPAYAYSNASVAVFTIEQPHEQLRKRFRTSSDDTIQYRRTRLSNEWVEAGFFRDPWPHEIRENGFRTIYVPTEGISNLWRFDETNELSFPISLMGKTLWTLKLYTPMTTGSIQPPQSTFSTTETNK